jgi:hypothetical protein
VDCRESGGIVSSEPLDTGERIRVNFDLVSNGLKALNAALKRRLVAHSA